MCLCVCVCVCKVKALLNLNKDVEEKKMQHRITRRQRLGWRQSGEKNLCLNYSDSVEITKFLKSIVTFHAFHCTQFQTKIFFFGTPSTAAPGQKCGRCGQG